MLRSSQALLLRRLSPSPLQLLWRVLWAMLLGSTWIYLDLLGGTCNAREDNTYNEPSSCQVGPGHCQWLKGHVSDAFYISRLLMVRRQCPRSQVVRASVDMKIKDCQTVQSFYDRVAAAELIPFQACVVVHSQRSFQPLRNSISETVSLYFWTFWNAISGRCVSRSRLHAAFLECLASA